MNKEQIRIGILGASKIAPDAVIAPAQKIDRVNIAGIAASTLTKAKDYGHKYGIPYSTGDYDELISSHHIDLVYVSLINSLHYEYALKAINNKKHVLIEKPICLTYNEYKEIEAQALKNGVVVMEAMMVEHHPWQNEIRKIISQREYGRIKKIESYNNFILHDENDFRVTAKSGGGAIYDLACYCLQFVQSLIGLDFKFLSCETNKYGPYSIDTEFQVCLSTNNDINIEMHGSFNKPFKAYHKVECEEGIIEVKNFFRAGFGFNKMHLHCTNSILGVQDVITFDPMNYYYNQLIDLSEAIDTGKYLPRLKEAGERVKAMEKLHEIKIIKDHQASLIYS